MWKTSHCLISSVVEKYLCFNEYTESKKAEHVYQEIKVIKEVTSYIFQQWLFVLCAFVWVCVRLDLRTNGTYLKGYLSDQDLEKGIIVSYWTMVRESKHYATLHPCNDLFFVDVPLALICISFINKFLICYKVELNIKCIKFYLSLSIIP